MQIDLIWIAPHAEPAPNWSSGSVIPTGDTAAAISQGVSGLPPDGDYVLFWHAAEGEPDPERILAALQYPGDVWHAGLKMGLDGLPGLIDYVDPVWRLNRDPDPTIVAMSWRLSLRACLARHDVLKMAGGPDPAFQTLDSASLEMGHRWFWSGAMMRHVPDLIAGGEASQVTKSLPLSDEFLFVRRRYGRLWAGWSGWRAWRNGQSLTEVITAARWADQQGGRIPTQPLRPVDSQYVNSGNQMSSDVASVTILIPTLDRYPHLFNLLDQLREQVVQPLDIVVVDQTDRENRQEDWPEDFADLPLQVIWRDEPGQCSSRNAGLRAAQGEYILFLDDDDEVEPDLIACHLDFLDRFRVDASCGVAEEVGAGQLPAEFRLVRDSDVFPTNNSLLRRDALLDSGLFDLAYERGERADGDLGMRLYLSGSLLALNPDSSVIHLHAPRGGLRQHDARVVTRTGSRNSLRQRHLLAPTEAYLWWRYFTPRQVNEALLIRSVSTVRGRRPGLRGMARAALMVLLLPATIAENRRRLGLGKDMLASFPSIPALQPQEFKEII